MKASALLKKTAAVFTAAVIVLSFYSCKAPVEEETTYLYPPLADEQIPGGALSVPYNSSDSLNPYACTSVLNNSAMSLIYRNLYRISTSFDPVRDLAENESITGNILKVYLVPDVVFSDKTPLTAEDVVYSFNCAKYSYVYSESLKGIESCTAEGDSCVVFELSYADENVLNSLSFPITKNGTADNFDSLAVGCGYYQFHDDGIRLSLKANLSCSLKLPDIGTVILTDVRGNTTPENLVTTKDLDFCYSDLADANIVGVNCSTTSVYLNNLVYMGINHENVNLALASFRQALFYGINRQEIAESAFMGFARSATAPFNSSWSKYMESASYSSMSLTGEPEKAKKLLAARDFGEGGNALNLVLICNEGNAFIRNTAACIVSDLAKFNVNITIRLLSPAELQKTVEAGEYDLYLAEMKIPVNMDIAEFFTPGSTASSGINFDNCTSDEAYFRYRAGEIGLDDFIAYFNSDMPFVPLAYRNARFCYTRDVTSHISVNQSNIFGDINIWTFSDNLF